MDCREHKCYRENILDYNRKTWLNIQKMTYDDCYDVAKKCEKKRKVELKVTEKLLKTGGPGPGKRPKLNRKNKIKKEFKAIKK